MVGRFHGAGMTPDVPSKRPLVGMIVPSSNPTVERALQTLDVCRHLGVDFVVTRVAVTDVAVSRSSMSQFGAVPMSRAAALLADAAPDLIVWAGTSGLWRGRNVEDAEVAQVATVGRCPSTSSRRAVLAALAEEDGPVAMLTPYVTAVHRAVVEHLLGEGVEVAESEALGVEENLAFARLDPELLRDSVRRLSAGSSRRVVVACTNVMVVAREALVVDSLLATLWHAARLAGGRNTPYRDFYRMVSGQSAEESGPIGRRNL